MNFSIKSLGVIPAQERIDLAVKLKECFDPQKESGFVGLSEEEYQTLITGQGACRNFYVLCAQNKFAGVVELVFTDSAIELDALFVEPNYRHQGLGRLLVSAALYYAAMHVLTRQTAIHHLEISVLKRTIDLERTLQFFECLGATRQPEGFYLQDGINYPTHRLRLNLPDCLDTLKSQLEPFLCKQRDTHEIDSPQSMRP